MNSLVVRIPFGRSEALLEIPTGAAVLERKETPYLEDPLCAVAESLREPFFSTGLHQISSGKGNAVIVVSDNTRPVPDEILLGSKHFEKGLRKLAQSADLDGYMSYISNMKNLEIDQWEVEELAKVLRKARISLYAPRVRLRKSFPGIC